MSILTALLISHGTLMNSRYTALVTSNAYLREKVKSKASHLTELCSEIYNLEKKYEKTQQDCHASDQENKDLHSFCDASSHEIERLRVQLARAEATAARDLEKVLALERSESQKYRDIATAAEKRFDDLRGEVTRFMASDIDGLVWKLLSTGEGQFDIADASLPLCQFLSFLRYRGSHEQCSSGGDHIQPDKIVCLAVSASCSCNVLPIARRLVGGILPERFQGLL
ncbi:hypothetical protein Tco_1104984 [Tanacetum coccineum]